MFQIFIKDSFKTKSTMVGNNLLGRLKKTTDRLDFIKTQRFELILHASGALKIHTQTSTVNSEFFILFILNFYML